MDYLILLNLNPMLSNNRYIIDPNDMVNLRDRGGSWVFKIEDGDATFLKYIINCSHGSELHAEYNFDN